MKIIKENSAKLNSLLAEKKTKVEQMRREMERENRVK